MEDELVEVPGLLRKSRLAVAALFRGAELVFEEGIILGADYGEVVGHFEFFFGLRKRGVGDGFVLFRVRGEWMDYLR